MRLNSLRYLTENKLIPKDDNLEIYWYKRDGIKVFTVVCQSCGNNRLLVHENGLRCVNCGSFHSHDNFQRMKEKIERAKKFNGQAEQVPQPWLERWQHLNQQRSIIEFNKQKKVGFTKLGTNQFVLLNK